ncbi:MAG: glycosyltransferase family 2 protein [Lachnospiraceae bacterium]|nr:glycosyltransferase family 2 protein [Lachnospiraceae bacterium]
MTSIVIPVHNARDYIAETIESVRAQTDHEWELILVDDASTDDSAALIRKIIAGSKEMISLIPLSAEEGGSAARARNAGIEAALGRYIAFLDADDLWMPEKLSRTLAFMKEREAAFAFTSYAFGDEAARPTGKEVRVPETLTFEEALSRTVIFTSTVIFDTKRIAKKWIRMPEIESEDTATWWRILRRGVTAQGLDEVLTVYRRSGKSLSSNKLKAVKRIWRLYRDPGVAGLSLPSSVKQFFGWAFRATARRI